MSCERFAGIPALRIPWYDQSGPIPDKDYPTSLKEASPSRWQTKNGFVSSPPTAGRWDLDRTTPTHLNQGKLVLFIFKLKTPTSEHTPNTEINAQQARNLADILARISSSIPGSGELEWNTPRAKVAGRWTSLALRHQPLIANNPVDPL